MKPLSHSVVGMACVGPFFLFISFLASFATTAGAVDTRFYVPDDGGNSWDRTQNWTNGIPTSTINAWFLAPRYDWERTPYLSASSAVRNITFDRAYALSQVSQTNDTRNATLAIHGDITVNSADAGNPDLFDLSYNRYLPDGNPGSAVQVPVVFPSNTVSLFVSNQNGRVTFVDSVAWAMAGTHTVNLTGRGAATFATPRNAWSMRIYNNSAANVTNYSGLCAGYVSGYTSVVADVINVLGSSGSSGGLVLTPADKGQYRRYTNSTPTSYIAWEEAGDIANVIQVGTVNLTTNNARLAVSGYTSAGSWGNTYWGQVNPVFSATTKGGLALINRINVAGDGGSYTSRIDQYNAVLNVATVSVNTANTLVWNLGDNGATQGVFTKTGAGTLKSTRSGTTVRFTSDITVSEGTYEDNVGVASGRNVTIGSGATLNSRSVSSGGGLYTLNSGATASDIGSSSTFLVKNGATLNAYGTGGGAITVESGGTVNTSGAFGGGRDGWDSNMWEPGWYWYLNSANGNPWFQNEGYAWGIDAYADGSQVSGAYDNLSVQSGGVLNALSAGGAATKVNGALTLGGTVNMRVGIGGDAAKADSLAVGESGTLNYGGALAIAFDSGSAFSAGQSWRLFQGGAVAGTPTVDSSVTLYPWQMFHDDILNNGLWDGPENLYLASDGNGYYGDDAIAWFWSDFYYFDMTLHWTVEQITANNYGDETYVINHFTSTDPVSSPLAATTANHFSAVTASGKFGNLTFTHNGSGLWTARTAALLLTFNEATGTLSAGTGSFTGTILIFK